MNPWKRYLIIYFAVFITGASLFASYNLIVDPLGRTQWVNKKKFNEVKFYATSLIRDFKANVLYLCDYDHFILGTSRVESGVNPAWLPEGRGFNGALGGSTSQEVRYVTDYLLEHQKPKTVVWGLDFIQFNDRRPLHPGFEASFFYPDVAPWLLFKYALSADTYEKSQQVLAQNRFQDIKLCNYDGLSQLPELTVDPQTAFYVTIKRYVHNEELYNPRFNFGEERLREFEYVVTRLKEEGVDVYLFIPPIHSAMQESINAVGLESEFVRWRRALVESLGRINEGVPEDEQVKLWDFTGNNSINDELIQVDTGRSDNFRDPAHMRLAVGELVMDRVLGRNNLDVPDDFGVALTPDNIDAWERDSIAGRDAYRAGSPWMMEQIEEIVTEYNETKGTDSAWDDPSPGMF